MNKKLIRKMQTAAGGPLRIKFTPEQIALFESQATRVPGMNNSGGNKYREEGVLALQHLKQGGKMDVLEFLKNGNKIYIKPKNRGKFTEYCHGKVTDECIRKAKASGNPTLVKRATFALNARRWKHLDGGLLDILLKKGGAFRTGVNVLDSNPKMSKAASKKVKKHLYGGDINNPNANGGVAFKIWLDNQLKLPQILKQKQLLEEEKLQEKLIEDSLKKERYGNIALSILGIGQKYLGNLLNNKSTKVDNGSPSSTTNFWNTPTIKNSQVTGDFWNNPTIANSLT